MFACIGVLLVGAGSLLEYFYAYRNSSWVQGSYYSMIIFGWLLLAFSLIPLLPTKPGHWLRRVFYGFLLLMGIAVLLANLLLVDSLGQQRVQGIIAAGAADTIATVTRLEERFGKGTTFPYAIITYRAGTQLIEMPIYDRARNYVIGQKINIRYALAYPDMFIVTGTDYKLNG